MKRMLLAALLTSTAVIAVATTVEAQVRFGRNVRIGGHYFENQSYRSVRMRTANKRPPWRGCRWFAAGSVYQGQRLASRTRICNLPPAPPRTRY